MILYEIWEEYIDINSQSHFEKIKTFMDKRKARNNLHELNAQCEFWNPYSLRIVKK